MCLPDADQPSQSFRRYRAPRKDGEALVDPPWPGLLELVEQNRASRPQDEIELFGRPLGELAEQARTSLIQQAVEFTSRFCELPALRANAANGALILSGHQPEFFHPGVWLKNFALDSLAKQTSGVGIHLLIDSDLCRDTAIRVPTGNVTSPRVEAVAFDDRMSDMPWEVRNVANAPLLASFGQRVARTLGSFAQPDLLAKSMTDDMVACAKRHGNLGEAISQSRRLVEQRWGSETLELPLSHVCDSKVFHWFALWLMNSAPQVREAYNRALDEYRTAHRLRNAAQPLPDLGETDGYVETPLWIWTADDPVRRPLFVQRRGGQLLLSDGRRGKWQLSATGDKNDRDSNTQQLKELSQAGVRIRSRALITTLFARLFLCDLFLHGIGGAKYDQVTDLLVHNLWGIKPPRHATLSATVRLPIEHESVSPSQATEIKQLLRKLRYHPEKYVADKAAAAEVAAKRVAIAITKTAENAADRHRQIEAANAGLQPFVESQRQALLAEQDQLAERLRASAILDSREYAFCLFPQNYLFDQMRKLVES